MIKCCKQIHVYRLCKSVRVWGRSDMALLYNDKAVLENHHVSAAFRLMKEDDCNILANMRREDHKSVSPTAAADSQT